jgi:hypothetical protein
MAFSFVFSGSAEKQPLTAVNQRAARGGSSLSVLAAASFERRCLYKHLFERAASLNIEPQPHLPEPDIRQEYEE